jgi:hypothetical protein
VAQKKQTAQVGSPSPEKTVQPEKPKNQKVKQQSHAHENGRPIWEDQHQWKQAFPQNKCPTADPGHNWAAKDAVRLEWAIQATV